MPLKLMPMDELIAWLDANQPQLEWEVDRDWVWILSDLAPLHRKCECEGCKERAAIRKAIGREGVGFSYAPHGHECPSGAVSHWGHRCEHPTKFRRRGGGKKPEAASQPNETTEQVSDADLLALIGG